MGQPTPPGDMPLVEGLGVEWNDVVSAFPKDKRAELGSKLKDRIGGYETQIKEFEPYDQFRKSNITPEHIDTAINLFSMIENEPKKIYEAIGEHLGISTAEAKSAVKEMEKTAVANGEDPRLQTMQEQLDTLAQIELAKHQMQTEEQAIAEADAEIDADLKELRDKFGDIDEDEIIMRMLQLEMTAEEAYNHYSEKFGKARPIAPMVMGQGGSIPSRAVDVTKLDSKATKSLVAQMLAHGNAERNS